MPGKAANKMQRTACSFVDIHVHVENASASKCKQVLFYSPWQQQQKTTPAQLSDYKASIHYYTTWLPTLTGLVTKVRASRGDSLLLNCVFYASYLLSGGLKVCLLQEMVLLCDKVVIVSHLIQSFNFE